MFAGSEDSEDEEIVSVNGIPPRESVGRVAQVALQPGRPKASGGQSRGMLPSRGRDDFSARHKHLVFQGLSSNEFPDGLCVAIADTLETSGL